MTFVKSSGATVDPQCSLEPPDSTSQTVSQLVQPFLHKHLTVESPNFTVCIKMRLTHDLPSVLLPSVLSHCWLGGRKGMWPLKIGGWWRWTLLSPDGVAPSRMVSVSASVNLPLHHKVQKFSSGTGSPGWSRKRTVKRSWCGGNT